MFGDLALGEFGTRHSLASLSSTVGTTHADVPLADCIGFMKEGVQYALASDWNEAFSSLDHSIDAIFTSPRMAQADLVPVKELLKRMVDVGSRVSSMTDEEFLTISVVTHSGTFPVFPQQVLPDTEPKIEELVD